MMRSTSGDLAAFPPEFFKALGYRLDGTAFAFARTSCAAYRMSIYHNVVSWCISGLYLLTLVDCLISAKRFVRFEGERRLQLASYSYQQQAASTSAIDTYSVHRWMHNRQSYILFDNVAKQRYDLLPQRADSMQRRGPSALCWNYCIILSTVHEW